MNTQSFEATPSPSTCPTCGRREAHPFRRVLGGEVIEGCIDGFHSDAMLHLDSPEAAWHWRPVAIQFRAAPALGGRR